MKSFIYPIWDDTFNFVHGGKNHLLDRHETFHYICMEKNFMSFNVYGKVPTHLCQIINQFEDSMLKIKYSWMFQYLYFPFKFVFFLILFYFENINICTNNMILESKLPTYYNFLNQIFNSTYFLGAHFKSNIELLLILTKVKVCTNPIFL
jgi:hypothetical protein